MDIKTARQIKEQILKFINLIENEHRIAFRRIDTIASADDVSTDLDLVFRPGAKKSKTSKKKGSDSV